MTTRMPASGASGRGGGGAGCRRRCEQAAGAGGQPAARPPGGSARRACSHQSSASHVGLVHSHCSRPFVRSGPLHVPSASPAQDGRFLRKNRSQLPWKMSSIAGVGIAPRRTGSPPGPGGPRSAPCRPASARSRSRRPGRCRSPRAGWSRQAGRRGRCDRPPPRGRRPRGRSGRGSSRARASRRRAPRRSRRRARSAGGSARR